MNLLPTGRSILAVCASALLFACGDDSPSKAVPDPEDAAVNVETDAGNSTTSNVTTGDAGSNVTVVTDPITVHEWELPGEGALADLHWYDGYLFLEDGQLRRMRVDGTFDESIARFPADDDSWRYEGIAAPRGAGGYELLGFGGGEDVTRSVAYLDGTGQLDTSLGREGYWRMPTFFESLQSLFVLGDQVVATSADTTTVRTILLPQDSEADEVTCRNFGPNDWIEIGETRSFRDRVLYVALDRTDLAFGLAQPGDGCNSEAPTTIGYSPISLGLSIFTDFVDFTVADDANIFVLARSEDDPAYLIAQVNREFVIVPQFADNGLSRFSPDNQPLSIDDVDGTLWMVEKEAAGSLVLARRDRATAASEEPVDLGLTGDCDLRDTRVEASSLMLLATCSTDGEPSRGVIVHLRPELLP